MARREARDRTERDRGTVKSRKEIERERLSENTQEREHFSLSRGAIVALVSKGKGNRGAIVLSLSLSRSLTLFL